MVSLLKSGSTWPLDPIDEELQQSDLQEALEFGNHKGGKTESKIAVGACVKGCRAWLHGDIPFVKGFINPRHLARACTNEHHASEFN